MKARTEPKFVLRGVDNQPLIIGSDGCVREKINEIANDVFGFHIMLEHSTEENELTVFLHSENLDDLSESELNTLRKASLVVNDSEENNHEALMKTLGMTVSHE